MENLLNRERLKELRDLIDRLAVTVRIDILDYHDLMTLFDSMLAEPTKTLKCPNCNGSGVYQEHDEYDRYTVHECAKCGGSGELLAEPSDEGRFPDEAESEYRKNFEAKCKKTGVNLLSEPSDTAVAEAIEDLLSGVECADELTDEEYIEVHLSPQGHELALQALRQYQKPSGSTSDGYHTFDELYEHRTALFATLCNMRSDISWKSMKHNDGTMYDGMFIAGIKTPEGQYTYHCNMKYLYMFAYTPEIEKAPAYDGHQPSDYPRLLGLSENSLYHRYGQSATSEEVADAIEKLTYARDQDREFDDGTFVDSLDLAITALQAYQPWIPVSERLPGKPEYDWVLVHITLYPDGFVGLPHVAELRRGEWFSTEYDLPIEQILQGTVTHWKPLPQPPKGE